MIHRSILVLAVLLFLGIDAPARADYATLDGAEISEGQMRIARADLARLEGEAAPGTTTVTPSVDRFILERTEVEGEISGVLARVRVEQVFRNPYSERLEVLYVFPLPEDAAVDGYRFQIGELVVDGVVKTREEARRDYESARDDGRKAALLEEERANIFSQSLANVPPDAEVRVRIEYVHPVEIDDTRYTFRFPMVVAPRYVPGTPLARPNLGRGWGRDTDEVPDASRITPPVLPEGVRRGDDVSIHLVLDAGMPIQGVTAVTHEIDVVRPSPTRAEIRLKNGTTIPNKDFVVDYRLDGERTVLASLVHRPAGGANGYVGLFLQPKRDVTTAELAPREVVLVLDRSGSMNGASISQLRILAQEVLAHLNPQDRFRVISFASDLLEHHAAPAAASPEEIERAKAVVRSLQPGGGTNMLPALKAAFSNGNPEEGAPRQILLLSDALVGNDDQILGWLAREGGGTRLFPVAIGSAPNHYLIRRAAEIGRGFSMHVTNEDNAAEMAKELAGKISKPYLTDLELDWGGLDVTDVSPAPLPDLYAGEPLVVLGRYGSSGTGRVTLKGNLGGQAVSTILDLELPREDPTNDALAPVWAERRIRQIWNRNLGRESREAKNEITRLGLEHQLVTRYTSFVAVETTAPTATQGALRTEVIPSMLPEGMKETAAPPHAFYRGRTTIAQPGTAPRPSAVSRPSPRAVPDDVYVPRSGGRSFGGSVEGLFLIGVGLLGAARLRTRGAARCGGRR